MDLLGISGSHHAALSPFLFQCGIVLSIVLLLLSSYVTRLVCSYMVKSAIISRRKNFEQIGKWHGQASQNAQN